MKVPCCPLAIPLPPWALTWGPARLQTLARCLQGQWDTCAFRVHDLPPKDLGGVINTPLTLAAETWGSPVHTGTPGSLPPPHPMAAPGLSEAALSRAGPAFLHRGSASRKGVGRCALSLLGAEQWAENQEARVGRAGPEDEGHFLPPLQAHL